MKNVDIISALLSTGVLIRSKGIKCFLHVQTFPNLGKFLLIILLLCKNLDFPLNVDSVICGETANFSRFKNSKRLHHISSVC